MNKGIQNRARNIMLQACQTLSKPEAELPGVVVDHLLEALDADGIELIDIRDLDNCVNLENICQDHLEVALADNALLREEVIAWREWDTATADSQWRGRYTRLNAARAAVDAAGVMER
jgi:hypothetical protein